MSLVETDWLFNNLNKVKIIDCSWHMPQTKRNGFEEYKKNHIPGAIFFDLDENSKKNTNLPHMLVEKTDWEKMENLPIKAIVEAAILAADGPLSLQQLREIFDEQSVSNLEIKQALSEIEKSCEGRGFELKKVASGYRFQVKVDYSDWVSKLWKEKTPRYSRALLETLALIAYRQPITRGDIEDVRGVSVSSNIMRTLIERDWIKIIGHREAPGRPALYATTKAFLDYFNLERLDQLPTLQEAKGLAQKNDFSKSKSPDSAFSDLPSDLFVEEESDLLDANEVNSNGLSGQNFQR